MTGPADLPGRLRALWEAPDSAPALQVDGAWVPWGTLRALADEILAASTASAAVRASASCSETGLSRSRRFSRSSAPSAA